jgi:hypothetical protein
MRLMFGAAPLIARRPSHMHVSFNFSESIPTPRIDGALYLLDLVFASCCET